ncbi:MAG: hypothetical protein SLAVMIC_00640 [uncultured marine phage]|uniref:Uncharacterized protein n=1 Tax=uncultured marine phage TaxID=707152 RepID=A0A8D9CBW8_9VIRU|nr:MAG: hypothetical protein SLAVMIC_00640 [uncultured marine phage]
MKYIKSPQLIKEEITMREILGKIDKVMGIKHGVKVSKKVRENAKKALQDIKSGNINEDELAVENLKNVLNDIVKGTTLGIAFLFIPGSSLAIPLLRKLLRNKSKNKKVQQLLELTVESDLKNDSKNKDEIDND